MRIGMVMKSPTRRTVTTTVTAVPAAGQARTTTPIALSYALTNIQTSTPARVRLYPTDAAAVADLNRAQGADPDPFAALVMEYVTDATHLNNAITPTVGGAQPTPTGYLTIGNTGASTTDITLILTYLALEG